MANKLAKRKATNKKSTNMADQPDYETLVNNIAVFTIAAIWVEKEIKKYRASNNKFDLALTLDGITPGNKWASMKTISHFNLGIALELLLKLLCSINGEPIPQGHKLTALQYDLPPLVRQRLESTFQDSQRRFQDGLKRIALLTNPPPEPPPPENRDLSTRRDFFEYFDEDVKLSLMRYSWEFIEKREWRHYLDDLSLFIEVINKVVTNIGRYIDPGPSAEHGGTGERVYLKRGRNWPAIRPHLLYNDLYKSNRVFRKQPYKYRRLTGFYSFGKKEPSPKD